MRIFVNSIVICVASFASVSMAQVSCPPNEELSSCGSACPPTCSTPSPEACDTACIKGCFCLQGYLRNSNGTCVKADLCNTDSEEAPVNYSSTPLLLPGSSVQLSDTEAQKANKTKEATLSNQYCGENEEYLPCGTACPATCTIPEPEVCGLACSMGCFCKEGFYRDEINHKCVKLEDCPVDTSFCFNENEVYDMCNAACEPSCTDPEPICTKVCKSGCICASGLLRSTEGDCVSVDKCPTVNGTAPDVLTKYWNAINNILHLTVA
ncbi:von Willebrand factor-like [Nymphalis io]|uniref:von Willebrand factor-like n=1 Tax=Inachis io TaxID=171585 RepID=UPI0021697A04|nr:von Willebrand factor-like [Nymphalis io]